MSLTLVCLLWIQAILSFCNLGPPWYYFQEISSNLGLYWLAFHLFSILLVLAAGKKSRVINRVFWVAALTALSWQYISPLLELYAVTPPTTHGPQDSRLRVLSANVYMPNQNFKKLRAIIDGYAPEVVALMEVDRIWIEELGLRSEFPYHIEIPRDDYFGLALYSRYPFVGQPETDVGGQLPPIIHATVELTNHATVELMVLHTIQPLFPESFFANRVLVRRLSTPLRHSDNPVLVLGDLNANWYSALYKRFREAGNLEDAMAGFGIFRTWNAENPLFRLTVDHLLYRGMSVLAYERGPAFGSDHFPIMGEFWVPSQAPRSSRLPTTLEAVRP